MRRLVFAFAMLIGGLVVTLLVHFSGTGGDEPDVSAIPYCTAGQTAANGCIPEEYGNIEKGNAEAERLAEELENQ